MIFKATKIPGVFIIKPEPLEDERGFFARTWCPREFEMHGLNPRLCQCNISFNSKKGTVRGMHFQTEPYAEAKIVRCTMGAIYDIALDLRPESPAFKQWTAAELSAENRIMLYLPEGVAHGFQTLADNSEVFYQMSEFYHPECSQGIRWNDPAFAIKLPLEPTVILDKDASFELWDQKK